MRRTRRWAVIEYRLLPAIALLSLLLAACNNGGKGPGY
jgi:predicted small secreted protein